VCDAITPQFVCNVLSGYTAGFEEKFEETFRSLGAPAFLQIDVNAD